MGYHKGLNSLRDIFAVLYSTKSKAHMVLGEVGITEQYINFNGSAIEFWRNILEFAQNNGQVQKIIDVAREHYPGNKDIVKAEHIFHETQVPTISIANNGNHKSDIASQTIKLEGIKNSGVIAGRDVTGVNITHVGDISGDGNQIGNRS